MTAPQFSLYTPIHRTLRRILFGLSEALGACDLSDEGAMASIAERLAFTMELLTVHAKHEEELMHPRVPEIAAAIAVLEDEHRAQDEGLLEVQRLWGTLAALPIAERWTVGATAYEQFNAFLSAFLEHMAREEQLVQGALRAKYPQEELMAIDQQIVQAVPPELMAGVLGDMMPAISHPERVAMLGGMKRAMPSDAFTGLLEGVVRPALTQPSFTQLHAALG